MNKLVSVIMPAYNASQYIGAAIESVLAQTYPAWELIIVDDGSTDDTLAIAQHYAELDKRIRVYRQENQGGCVARNTALKYAKGDYVQYLDADDMLHLEKIAVQMQYIEDNNCDDNVLVYGRCKAIVNDEVIEKDVYDICRDYNPAYKAILAMLEKQYCGFQYSVYLFSRNLIECVGAWNEKVMRGQDCEFTARAINQAIRMHYTAEAICYYRYVAQSVSRKPLSAKQIESEFIVADCVTDILLSHEKNAYTKAVCEKYYTSILCKYYPQNKLLINEILHSMERKNLYLNFSDRGKTFKILRFFLGWKNATILMKKMI